LLFAVTLKGMRPGSDPVQGLKDGITDAAKILGMVGAEQSQLRARLNISRCRAMTVPTPRR
jgi:hypothetical protein